MSLCVLNYVVDRKKYFVLILGSNYCEKLLKYYKKFCYFDRVIGFGLLLGVIR